jgi:ribonuclease HII
MDGGLGKRGIEKQPFQLPDFIAATGIEKIRQAYIEKEDSKKLKQKQREKMQPKMGKMDIDYQVCFTEHLLMLLQSHMDYHCIIHVVNIQHGGTAELGY